MPAPATPSNVKVVSLLDATNSKIAPKIKITWSANTESDILKYIIYRNFTPYGTFIKVGEVNAPIVTFTDEPTLETVAAVVGVSQGISQGLDGLWYYRVSAVNTGAEEGVSSDPLTVEEVEAFDTNPFTSVTVGPSIINFAPDEAADLSDNEDLKEYFQRIRYHALWMLMQDGQDVLLFKRKAEGIKCPFWQEDAQQCQQPLGDPKFNTSNSCYNTGIVGGYYAPIQMKMRIIMDKMSVSTFKEGMRTTMTPRSWTIWTPRLGNFDFIVTSDGSRYEVTNVSRQVARGGLITHQSFDLIRKWETEMICSVPITATLR